MTTCVMPDAAAVGRFRNVAFEFDGDECLAAGTGYTGEDGVELAVPAARAPDVWRAITSAGVEPAGLGARDTLRLEAGLPLHGHELGAGLSPLNAGLGWVVAWDKGEFRGRDALQRQREAGANPVLRAITVEGRRPPRADQRVLLDGAEVGHISSGNFSPTLGHGIALAFCQPQVEVGAEIEVDMRGSLVAGRVVKPPFVAKVRIRFRPSPAASIRQLSSGKT